VGRIRKKEAWTLYSHIRLGRVIQLIGGERGLGCEQKIELCAFCRHRKGKVKKSSEGTSQEGGSKGLSQKKRSSLGKIRKKFSKQPERQRECLAKIRGTTEGRR